MARILYYLAFPFSTMIGFVAHSLWTILCALFGRLFQSLLGGVQGSVVAASEGMDVPEASNGGASAGSLIYDVLRPIFILAAHPKRAAIYRFELVNWHWHLVTRSIPVFWSYFSLDRFQNYSNAAELANRVQEYAARSRQLRIRALLDFHLIRTLDDAEIMLPALHLHFRRFHSLDLILPDCNWIDVVSRNSGNLRLGLTKLSVSLIQHHIVPRPHFSSILSGVFPHLVEIDLHDIFPFHVLKFAAIPNVRRFHLAFQSIQPEGECIREVWTQTTHAIKSAVDLQEVRLELDDDIIGMWNSFYERRRDEDGFLQPIDVLPSRVLKLSSGFVFPQFIAAPAVTHFELFMHRGPESSCFGCLWYLADAASTGRLPALRSLVISNCNTDTDTIMHLNLVFRSLPQLSKLAVLTSAESNRFIPSLLFRNLGRRRDYPVNEWSPSNLLPNLEMLTVGECPSWSAENIIRMVHDCRTGTGVLPITTLRIRAQPFDITVQETLRALVPELQITDADGVDT